MKEAIRSIILKIITIEAKAVLKRHKPKIILVSGSVGKTSTKDAIYTALKGSTFVRKSEKSYNSDIGVPLTVLGVPNGWSNIFIWSKNILSGLLLLISNTPYPKWLVVEVGADRPGDISKSLSWIKPNVVVLTRFPEIPVHVEFYNSPEDVVKEEMFPVTLLGNGGVAVLNYDYQNTKDLNVNEGVKTITYGLSKEADVYASRYRVNTRSNIIHSISFEIVHADEKVHVTVEGVIGEQHVYSVLAGVSGALASGVSLGTAVEAFKDHVSPPGRMSLIKGINNTAVIDDTYNSSPIAVREALKTIKSAPVSGRRIAILGDMLELGNYSQVEHEKVGELALGNVDVLITLGVRAKGIADKALDLGIQKENILSFDRSKDISKFLINFIKEGDTILIKGSQSMRMEKITESIMLEPDKAKDLLPRQNIEWLTR